MIGRNSYSVYLRLGHGIEEPIILSCLMESHIFSVAFLQKGEGGGGGVDHRSLGGSSNSSQQLITSAQTKSRTSRMSSRTVSIKVAKLNLELMPDFKAPLHFYKICTLVVAVPYSHPFQKSHSDHLAVLGTKDQNYS